MLQFIEACKKLPLKILQIECLDNALQSLDFTTKHFQILWTKVQNIFNKISKYVKSDDLQNPALKLMTTILVISPNEYFEEKIDSFLMKPLLKGVIKQNKKQACLDGILKILKGKYFQTKINWLPKKYLQNLSQLVIELTIFQEDQKRDKNKNENIEENKKFNNSLNLIKKLNLKTSFSSLTLRLLSNKAKMLTRLQNICQTVFNKKQPIPKIHENIDILIGNDYCKKKNLFL